MKTILITGSTSGIGKLAALQLAKDNHTLYLHGRDTESVQTVVSELKSETGNENVYGCAADFSDLDEVRHMASEIQSKTSHIDVLINNAGVYKTDASENKDGIDMRIVVNYLAPYAFTHALLPHLEKKKGARIINLSSAAQSPVSHEVLRGEKHLPESQTYAQSKLALTMWSFYLAKNNPGISVIAVNPGSMLNTKMVQEAFGHSLSSADKGAAILHELATSKRYENTTGVYFDNDIGTFGKAHPDAYDNSKIEKLIEATAQMVGV